MGEVVDFPSKEEPHVEIGYGDVTHHFPIKLLDNIIDGTVPVSSVDPQLMVAIVLVFREALLTGEFSEMPEE